MQFDKKQEIGAANGRSIRDAFRKFMNGSFSKDQLSIALGLAEPKASQTFDELEKRGLIERDGDVVHNQYSLSISGRALAMTRFTKRMTRAQIEKTLKEVIDRAERINSDIYFLSSISEIRVFGSYLKKENTDFGDLDLAICTERRLKNKEWVQQSLERAKASGKHLNYGAMLTYGNFEVLSALKARSPRISIHPIEELEQLGIDGVLVFQSGHARED